MTQIQELMYKGKAKDVFSTDEDDKVIVAFRDDITAGDGEKKGNLSKKGYFNSIISSKLFEVLEEAGIKTQFVELSEPGMMVSKKLDMLPLEVIARNVAAGSILKNFPFEDKQRFDPPLIQMDYKNDEYHDPMLNDAIVIALGLASQEDLNNIREITLKINTMLKEFLASKNIILVDFKLEFGKDKEGNIVLGDEISPDTCRYWDINTLDVLDKDLFRQGQDGVMNAYEKVCSMILDSEDIEKWGVN